MIYRLYDCCGILIYEVNKVEDALQVFGGVYDKQVDELGKGVADGMYVKVFVDKAKGDKRKFAEYTIREFLNKDPDVIKGLSKIAEEKKEEPKNVDSIEFENRAKNFDDEEQKICLKYIPTGFILGELARRFDEYSNAKAGIASIIENMKIYNKE